MPRMLSLGSSYDSATIASLLLNLPAAIQPAGLDLLNAPSLSLESQYDASAQDPQNPATPKRTPYDVAAIAANQYYARVNLDRIQRTEPDPAWQERTRLALHKTTGAVFGNTQQYESPELHYVVDRFVDLYERSKGTIGVMETSFAVAMAIQGVRSRDTLLAGSDLATFATDAALLSVERTPVGLGTMLTGHVISSALDQMEQSRQEEIARNMRLANKPVVRAANYKYLEHIAKENPELYDAVVSTIEAHQKSGLPVVGLEADTQKSRPVNLPDRQIVATDSQTLTLENGSNAPSLVSKGSKNQLTNAEKLDLKQQISDLEKQSKATSKVQEEFLRAAMNAGSAEATFINALQALGITPAEAATLPDPVKKLAAFVALQNAKKAEQAKREEFDKAAEQTALLLSRIDPKAGRIFGAAAKLSLKSAEILGSSGAELSKLTKLTNYLSLTNLGLALVDAFLGGKDPTQVYFEKLGEMITQLDQKIDGVSKQISNLHDDMLREFQVINIAVGDARWDIRFWGETVYRAVQDGFNRIEQLERVQTSLLKTLAEDTDRIVHRIKILDEKVDQLQNSFDIATKGISDDGLAVKLEQLRQSIDYPDRSPLTAEGKASLLYDIAHILPAVARVRSQVGHLARISSGASPELHAAGLVLTDFSSQSGALAMYIGSRTELTLSTNHLYDFPYLLEGLNLLLRASGQHGFPALDAKYRESLVAFLKDARVAQHELAKAAFSGAAEVINHELVILGQNRTELNISWAENQFPNSIARYSLYNQPTSLQVMAEDSQILIPRFQIGATLNAANISASAVPFKGIVENSHWYQSGYVKVFKEEIVGRRSHGAARISGPDDSPPETRIVAVDEFREAAHCGGPAEMKWSSGVSATINSRTNANVDLSLNNLLVPASLQKLYLMQASDWLRIRPHQTKVTTENVRSLGAQHTGNSGNNRDKPFRAGKIIFVSFKQTHLLDLRPELSGEIGGREALATYQVTFKGKVPTSVKIESCHKRFFRLDRYIRDFKPYEDWDTTGTKFHSEETLQGSPTSFSAMELDTYYADTNQVLESIGGLLRDQVVNTKGAAWTDGISEITLNSGLLENNIGLFKVQNQNKLRVAILHRADGHSYFDLDLPANHISPATLPYITLKFNQDFRVLRADAKEGTPATPLLKELKQREGDFHQKKLAEYVLTELDHLQKAGTPVQRSLRHIVAASLLLKKSIETFGGDFIAWDLRDCITHGRTLADSVSYRLNSYDGSILDLLKALEDLRHEVESRSPEKPVDLEGVTQILETFRKNLITIEARLRTYEEEGGVFQDQYMQRLSDRFGL